MIRRYLCIGLLVVAVLVGVFIFFYRTEQPLPIGKFGGVSLIIDYATTTTDREKGLSGRTSIPSDYGMLFVFQEDDQYGFWMKDMLVPIDIFWLNSEGQVVTIAQYVATSSYPNVFYPTEPAQYVLETAAGFAMEHAIATGTQLMLKNFPIVSK